MKEKNNITFNYMKEGDILEGIININKTKNGYLTNETLNKDLFIFKNNLNTALNLDKVKVVVVEGIRGGYEGEVLEVLERNTEQFVGKVEKNKNKTFVYPTNKNINVKFVLTQEDSNKVENEQIVVVKIAKWTNPNKNPVGELIKILGQAGEHETEIHSILEEFNLPYEFPQEVLNEAELISEVITQKEIDKRRDLRNFTVIGIDPYDSRDADDTIGLEWVDGEAIISVNIADVSFYVKPNSAIYNEAYLRGNSFYFPDRCVSMLPERLSNNICSLKSGSDKLCFSAIFRMDKKGKIIERWFGRTVVNVNKDYSYEEAQNVIENGIRDEHKETDQIVLDLNDIAKNLRKEISKNGILSLDKPEIKFILDENKNPIDIVFKTSKDSNKLIEQFMLLANREVAKFIKSKGVPCINRVHEYPNDDKLESLKTFVAQFGYELKISNSEEIKSSLNMLLENCKGTLEEDLIKTLVTRTQQKAIYSTSNLPHWALNFPDYQHFTSPIRRASDLFIHMILANVLGNDGYPIKK